jgi:hypothetical protein
VFVVKFVRTWESFLEKYIEGYCNAKFSGDLQPAEIAKKLVREMENKRSVGVSKTYVPNHYQVALTAVDHESLLPVATAIQDELAQFLLAEIAKRGYTILSHPSFEFLTDSAMAKGKFVVTGEFTEAIPYEKIPQLAEGEEPTQFGETKTFARTVVAERSEPPFQGLITVVEGPDVGLKLKVGTQRFHMGRRESNELPLTDMNTSRLHAYIYYEAGQHVLIDAKSLNGTYVNGQRVSRKTLQSGDKIKIGHTLLCYEVV